MDLKTRLGLYGFNESDPTKLNNKINKYGLTQLEYPLSYYFDHEPTLATALDNGSKTLTSESKFTVNSSGIITAFNPVAGDTEITVPPFVGGIKVTGIADTVYNSSSDGGSIINFSYSGPFVAITGESYSNGNTFYSWGNTIKEKVTIIHLPNTITSLGNKCLFASNITSLVLPKSITSMNSCFQGSKIATIKFTGPVPATLTGNMFETSMIYNSSMTGSNGSYTCNPNIKSMLVPSAHLAAYKAKGQYVWFGNNSSNSTMDGRFNIIAASLDIITGY